MSGSVWVGGNGSVLNIPVISVHFYYGLFRILFGSTSRVHKLGLHRL